MAIKYQERHGFGKTMHARWAIVFFEVRYSLRERRTEFWDRCR